MGLVLTKRKKSLVALVAAMMGGLLALPVFLVSPAAAQNNQQPVDTSEACAGAEQEQFTDVDDDNVHQENIACLAAYEVTQGKTATTYGSGENVLRMQMASFLVRKLQLVEQGTAGTADEYELPENPDDEFPDDEGSVHEPNINIIAAIGITLGYNDGTYKPVRAVSRAEMASFIVRQLQEVGFDLPDNPPDAFDDDEDSVHEPNINMLAALGIVVGTGDRQYNPEGAVTRDAMGSFIARDIAVLVDAGLIDPLTDQPQQATATSRPELVSASIVQTTTQGTTVRYTFDEALTGTGVNPGNFHVYRFGYTGADPDAAGPLVAGPQDVDTAGADDNTGDVAQVDNNDTRSVLVTFTGITTATGAAQLSVATVDFDAVRGLEGNVGDANTEGDAPLNAGTTSQLGARQTVGPDLTTVGNFRANPANVNETLVDFTFDEAAFNNNPTGYHLIDVDGTTDNVGTLVAGTGTATHTVAFQNNAGIGTPSTVPLTAADTARGTVDTGTVDDVSGAGGNINPQQAAAVTSTGISETPDLESAEIRRDVNVNGATRDQILYTFDEPVLVNPGFAGDAPDTAVVEGTTEQLFRAYLSDGSEVLGSAANAPATRSTTNDRQVLVTFGQDQLDLAVGASVSDGAVIEGSGAQNRPNQQDEVGVSNVGTGPTTVSGRTAAPDLTAVTIAPIQNAFGTTTGARATYIFDEDVFTTDAQAGNLFLYAADGTQYQCTGTTGTGTLALGTTEDTDNTVTCASYAVVAGGGAATTNQVLSAVLGTVDDGAVNNQAANSGPGTGTPGGATGGETNPEGAEVATGNA